MLKFLLALALVVVSVQCAAACTPAAAAPPPCHHHKQAPACSHELVPATIVQSYVASVSFSSEALNPEPIVHAAAILNAPTMQDPSPPGATVPPTTILRI